jgi:hypothetical protein
MNHPSPLEAIFFAALEKGAADERTAYLNEACAGDADLFRRLEKMLAAEAQASSFLEQPACSPGVTLDAPPDADHFSAHRKKELRPLSALSDHRRMIGVARRGKCAPVAARKVRAGWPSFPLCTPQVPLWSFAPPASF